MVLEEYMKSAVKSAVETYSAAVVAKFISSLYDSNLTGADLVEYRNLVDRLKKEVRSDKRPSNELKVLALRTKIARAHKSPQYSSSLILTLIAIHFARHFAHRR